MNRIQLYRVIVAATEQYFVDVPARGRADALERAERRWFEPHRSGFERLLAAPETQFTIDECASMHLEDVMNESRCEWAARAIKAFAGQTGSTIGQEALRDLLCDLGHYADSCGIDFRDEIARALSTWSYERGTPLPPPMAEHDEPAHTQ